MAKSIAAVRAQLRKFEAEDQVKVVVDHEPWLYDKMEATVRRRLLLHGDVKVVTRKTHRPLHPELTGEVTTITGPAAQVLFRLNEYVARKAASGVAVSL